MQLCSSLRLGASTLGNPFSCVLPFHIENTLHWVGCSCWQGVRLGHTCNILEGLSSGYTLQGVSSYRFDTLGLGHVVGYEMLPRLSAALVNALTRGLSESGASCRLGHRSPNEPVRKAPVPGSYSLASYFPLPIFLLLHTLLTASFNNRGFLY